MIPIWRSETDVILVRIRGLIDELQKKKKTRKKKKKKGTVWLEILWFLVDLIWRNIEVYLHDLFRKMLGILVAVFYHADHW